jgi:PAS domain S-box-containing protein
MNGSNQYSFLSEGCSGVMDTLIINNILDSMSDSLLVLGEDGEILFANKVTKEILGYSIEDFRQKGLAALFFLKDQNQDFTQLFVDAVWKKSINNYSEVDYLHPDGMVKRLAATTSYLLADGEHDTTFIGFVALFKDITETFNLRKKEQELEKEKERIAAGKIRSLHKLAMGVAHEIRNPMVTIGGFAARISRDEGNSDTTRQYAENILEDARRLETVVDEIQAYCNLPEIRLMESTISTVLGEVAAEAQIRAKSRNIRILFSNALNPSTKALLDSHLLKMALMRLLDNAVDFSLDGSDVFLLLYEDEGSLVIEVKDNGVGIDRQDQEFIFNPFFSTRIHASGMGLAIVERIVHEHMGCIEVNSSKGKGTSIKIVMNIIPNKKT